MNCPKCGAVVQSPTSFCPVCGNDLGAVNKEEHLKQEVKRQGFSWFKLLLIIGLVICAILFWKGLKEEDPTDVVKEQLQALHDNKITEAYYAYTSKDFQNVTPLDKFKEFIKSYPTLLQSKKVELSVKDTPDEDIKVIEGNIVSSNNTVLPVEYQTILENSKWKILYMRFITTGSAEAAAPSTTTAAPQKGPAPAGMEAMTNSVKALLDHLKANEINQAYNSTSKSFQNVTTLEGFRQFLEAYPILTQFNSYSFGAYSLQNNTKGNLNVELQNDDKKALMVFNLGKTNGQWQVQGIQHLEETAAQENLPEFNSKNLMSVIDAQLNAIRQGQVSSAYYDYTSKKFREKINFAQFTKFVNSNPIFGMNRSTSLEEIKFDKNIANMTVSLSSTTGLSRRINYSMELENGKWKIDYINFADKSGLSVSGGKPITPLQFEKAIFGTQIDESGTILDPGLVLKAHQSDIYVDIYIKNAAEGDIIQVEFEFLDNSTKVPVMAYTVPKNGDQMITLSFSPPPEGWTKGSYRLTLTSLSGGKRAFSFMIE